MYPKAYERIQQDKLEEHSLRESATAKEVIDTLWFKNKTDIVI